MDRPRKPSAISASLTSDQHAKQPSISITPSSVTASLATGESVSVLLHGATVTSWKSGSSSPPTENLFLSSAALLDGSKPVRGGIPLVFPVFGPPPPGHATAKLPQHGFARNVKWEFLGKSSTESGALPEGTTRGGGDDCVKLDFGLGSADLLKEAKAAWPYKFGLIYSVTLSRSDLRCMLNVRNEGDEAFEFQMLMHSYFRVKDITKTTLTGLLGANYTDKVLSSQQTVETSAALPITSEVDRVYTALAQDTTSILEQGKPRFDVVRDSLPDTVVWNPWRERAAKMGDFEPKDAYGQMICVEVGSVDGWQKLEGGDTFEAGQVVRALI